jgi:hypothetical protein
VRDRGVRGSEAKLREGGTKPWEGGRYRRRREGGDYRRRPSGLFSCRDTQKIYVCPYLRDFYIANTYMGGDDFTISLDLLQTVGTKVLFVSFKFASARSNSTLQMHVSASLIICHPAFSSLIFCKTK